MRRPLLKGKQKLPEQMAASGLTGQIFIFQLSQTLLGSALCVGSMPRMSRMQNTRGYACSVCVNRAC